MIFVVLILVVVLALQLKLAKSPILGLIVPMSGFFGTVIAVYMMLMKPKGVTENLPVAGDAFYKLSALLFVLLTLISFLLYFRERRKEYEAGYPDESSPKKEND